MLRNIASRLAPPAFAGLAALVIACGSDDQGTVPSPTSELPASTATATASPAGEGASSPTAPSAASTAAPTSTAQRDPELQAYAVPSGARPHDVAPALDGGVWYTGQGNGTLGHLDPETGEVTEIPLGGGSAPHGVIVGPDGDAWITDGGLNAIVRVDAETHAVTRFDLPSSAPSANLNTAVIDPDGVLWFTGQAGHYGRLDTANGEMKVWSSPRGRGPYGITVTPAGEVYYASLAGNYVGHIDRATGEVTVLEPPTPGQGARRVWSDSRGRIWVSEWNAGQVAVYDPADESWQEWPLPGSAPQAYAVYVDEQDDVWLTDFGGNAVHRFDPDIEIVFTIPLTHTPGNVRQLLGRPGEVWGAESAADHLIVIRY